MGRFNRVGFGGSGWDAGRRPHSGRIVAAGISALLVMALTVAVAYASEGKLQLISNGKPVAKGQRSAVITQATFPGFTCTGFNGAMKLGGDPAAVLKFFNPGGEGGGESFYSCVTGKGEPVSTATEGPSSKLHVVTVSTRLITEVFQPIAVFEDVETGCVWHLAKLSGPLPVSGSLENVELSATAKLVGSLSSRTCPKTGAVTATATIEAAPEGAPPGSYTVERIA